jgi:hypothetical protein
LTDSITSPRPFLHASWLSRSVPRSTKKAAMGGLRRAQRDRLAC